MNVMRHTSYAEDRQAIRELEEKRKLCKDLEERREREEFDRNTAEFLRKMIKNQDKRISDLEEMVVQMMMHMNSTTGFKTKWENIK